MTSGTRDAPRRPDRGAHAPAPPTRRRAFHKPAASKDRTEHDAGTHDAGAGRQRRKAFERDRLAEQVEAEAAGKGVADEDDRGRSARGMQQRDRRRAIERDCDHRHDEGRAIGERAALADLGIDEQSRGGRAR